jgi:UDP-glucose 4-epimerase
MVATLRVRRCFKLKKIVILGAGGFIGRYLLTTFSKNVQGQIIGNTSAKCDLLYPDSVMSGLSEVTEEDVIVMASGITRLTADSYDSMIKNIQMAENLCNFLDEKPVSQVVFLSTVEVYGNVPEDVMITETLLPNPNNYYAISKLVSEYLLRGLGSRKEIPLTVLRLPGVYGHGDYGKSVIDTMVTSAQLNGKIIVYDGGSAKRDFVYIDDLAKLIAEAILCKADVTVNVASGESHSILEIARMIASRMGESISIEVVPDGCSYNNRPKYIGFDMTFLRARFPGIIFTGIKSGIEKYLMDKGVMGRRRP